MPHTTFKYFKSILFAFIVSSVSVLTQAQNLITVPFANGFVGDNTANNQSTNAYYLSGTSGLGWSNVQFAQNSSSNIFVAQGNDIIGMVLITDNNGVEHTINGFIKWRAPSGQVTTICFQPGTGTNVTLATNGSNGASTYTITDTKYIGLTFNGSTLSISPVPGTVSGNAATSGLLDALNNYLGTMGSLSVADVTVYENVGFATVTVSLSSANSNTITVAYSTSSGTATTGIDFTAASGTLTFLPGQTSKTFLIPISDDAVVETAENIVVTLSDPTNASILDGSGLVTVNDNDFAVSAVNNSGCDPQSLYDVIGSAYHQSVAQKSDGSWSGWGQLMGNTGTAVLSPQEINVANYPALTGTPIKAATASTGSGSSEQSILLTTTGLFAWGTEDVIIPTSVTSSTTFQKLTVNGQTNGLPSGVNPSDVEMMLAMNTGLAILTTDGKVFVLLTTSSSFNYYGDGSTAINAAWHQVKINSSTFLTNVIAVRGQLSSSTKGSLMALTYDGSSYGLYAWGQSVYLGDGNVASAKNYATPMTMPTGITPKMIGVTGGNSVNTRNSSFYVLATNGQLFSLGANDMKQLGDFTTTERKTWVNAKINSTTNFTNVTFISAQEHDAKFPAAAAITTAGDLYMWGQNGGNMLGAITADAAYDPFLPGGFTTGVDIAKIVEVGGHTSVYLKENSAKFCYVGHKTSGSMGDGTNDNTNPYIFDCDATPVINICGSTGWDFGDSPIDYENGGGSNYAMHFYVSDPAIYLGTGAPTANDDNPHSVVIATDNNGTNGDGIEENSVSSFPTLLNSATSYSFPVSVYNNTGATANLYVWVDWNNNGKYQATEIYTTTVASSSSAQTITAAFSGLSGLNDGRRYVRIRFSTFALTDNTATTAVDERSLGFLADGEVEDYSLFVTTASASPNVAPVTNNVTNAGLIPLSAPATDIDSGSSSDSDGTVVAYRITSLPASGFLFKQIGLNLIPVSLNEAMTVADFNALKYQPYTGYIGSDLFTYAAIDDDGAEDSTPANFYINVYTTASADAGPTTASICAGTTYTTVGSSSNGTILWTTSGTGTFTNATTNNATYTPSASDLASGQVTLTMTVTGTASVSDNLWLSFTAAPTSGTISGTTTICSNGSTTLTSSVTGGTWSSATPAVATINSSTGAVAGVSAGTSVMTYTVAGTGGCAAATTTATVTVTAAPSAGTLSGTTAICSNGSSTLTSSVTGGSWSSATPAVATINSSTGAVAGVSAGTSVMTYTVTGTGGCAGATATTTTTVTVTAAPSAGTISGTTAICSNGTSTLTSSVTGGTWSSATPAVATINSSTGALAGVSAGTSVITYTVAGTGGCAAATTTATVTVTAAPSAGTISGTTAICSNGTSTLTSSVTGGSWSSATPAVATINSSTGAVAGVSAGTSVMTYTITGTGGCANVSTTATVTVTAAPSAGAISGTTAICSNGSSTLTSSVTGGTWSSATPAVATINSSTGAVAGVSAGTSVITYTVSGTGGCTAATTTATVTVTAAPSAGTISGTTAICSNGSSTLTSSVTGGTWSSATPAVATINSSTGAVAGVSAGTSVMTYTVAGTGGCTAATTTATVTVTNQELTSPSNNGNQTICIGETTSLVAYNSSAVDLDGSNDYIQAANGVYFDDNTYTIEGWVYVKSHEIWQRLIDFGNGEGQQTVIFALSNGTTGKPTFEYYTAPGQAITIMSSSAIPLNQWVHLAAVRDGSNATIYMNGIQVATTNTWNINTDNVTRSKCYIGKSNWADAYANAKFGELRIWSSARTLAQIQSNMYTPVSAQSDLRVLYRFDQGLANQTNTGITSLTDHSGANYNGGAPANATLYNFGLSGSTSNWTHGRVATPAGTWSSATPAVATINSTSGVVTGVSAGTSVMTYTIAGSGGCASVSTSATVTVNPAPAAPTVVSPIVICPGSTVADLQATVGSGETLQWFSTATGGSPLASTTLLIAGNTYYAQATNSSGCASSRAGVNVSSNNALSFDGANDRVNLTSNSIQDGATAFSIEAWIKPNNSNWDNQYHAIFGNQTGGNANTRNPSFYLLQGKIHVDTYEDNTLTRYDFLTNQALILQNVWSHIALVKSGNSYLIYINGNLAYTSPAPNAVNITGPYQFGYIDNYFAGLIDEVRFWNVARTQTQIQASMNSELVGNESGLIDYYNFNQGVAEGNNTSITTLNDNTTSANGGSIVNLALTGTSSNFVLGFLPQITGNTSVNAGSTIQLSHAMPGGTWSSSNNSIATVSASGLVTGVGAGTVTITYTFCGQSTTYTITAYAQTLNLNSSAITSFAACQGTASAAQSFTVSGTSLTANVVVTAPTGYEVSLSSASGYANSVTITASGTLNSTTIYIRIASTATAGTVSGNVSIASTGATTLTFSVTGTVTNPSNAGTLSGTTSICSNGSSTLTSSVSGGSWSSATPAVATIDASTGAVAGVSAGTSVMTYTVAGSGACPNVTATTTVTVTAAPSAGTISGTTAICSNGTSTLTSSVTGGTWSSATPAVATINSSTGAVTGVSAGTSVMTYTITGTGGCANVSTTATVTVTAAPSAGTISGTTAICSNGSSTLTSSVTGGSWSSATPAVATINSSTGAVAGVSAGTSVMTYTITGTGGCANVSTTATVTVTAAPSAGAISGTTAICSNGSSTLTSSVTGGTWSSATPAVATINSSTGAVAGVSAGTAIMTYTVSGTGGCANVSTTATVTVSAAPSAGTISGTTAICSNGSSTLTSSVTGGTWSSATPAVATINSSTGAVAGVSAGTSVMTYTVTGTGGCANVSTTATVTVTAPPSAGTISGTTAICSNGSSTLTSSVSGGSWSSATPAVATINSSTGAVAGVSAGTAVMTYTVSGTGGCANASTTATVTVSTAPNSGTISGNTSICSAGSTTLTTTATGGTWSSATPSVATINASTGAVIGVSGGTSLMTYTVTGTGGCANATSNVLVVVTATPATPIVSVTQPTCAITTGSINFTNVVGVQYSVNGSNYQVSSAFSYLQPGVYPIAIRSTSNTSCVATGTSVTIVASLGAPSLPTATITVQPTCAIPTGTIVVSSPLGAFDYSLNGTSYQSSTTFAGLAPGTYNLTARRTADQTCESAVVSFTIYPVPTTPVAPSAIATQPTCAVPTGTINFNAQTAVQYSINGTSYQSSGIFSNLTPGSYTLSVRNANDATCITTGSVITINASAGAPAAPTASATTQPTCAAPTGVITITAPIGAFTYSIDGVNYQAATTYSGLNPGTYNISTRRTNDITCISTATTVTINTVPALPSIPTAAVTQPTCAVQTGSINFVSQTAVQYALNNGAYQANTLFSGLAPGTYFLYARNVNDGSCISIGSPVVVNAIPSAPATPVVANVVQPICGTNTGSFTVSNPIGNFTYSINGTSYQANNSFSGLLPGTYNCTVRSTTDLTCVSAATAVTINAVPNCLPVANNDQASTNEDTPVSFNITNNDTDVDGTINFNSVDLDPSTPGIQTTVTNPQGTWTVTGGVVTFTPVANFNGAASINYTVNDNSGATTNVATVTVTVLPVNDAPVANNDSATTNEDSPVSFNITNNDTDLDGTIDVTTVDLDPTTPGIQTTFTNAQGTWTVTGGVVTFTPAANFNGSATINYSVNDNGGATTNVATITVTVLPVNDAPVANNDSATTNEDSPVSFNITNNDTDLDGTIDVNTVDLNPSTPGIQTTFTNAQGTWTVTGGVVTFTPASNFNGSATINYTVNDNGGATTNVATITVTVVPVNDAPVANNDSASTNEDSPVSFNITNNDTDLDGTIDVTTVDLDPTTPGIQTTFTNAQGTWTVTGGVVTFTPAANFNGSATINYTVNDNGGATTNVATITVTILPVNDAPVANNDSATTNEDTPVSFNITNNDTDLDGTIDVNTVDLNPTTPGIQTTFTNAQGTWTVNGGVVTFTPVANFNGSASINYTVNDNSGATTNVATITVTVVPVNDAPVANNDNASTNEDAPVSFNITSNDTDIDGTINTNSVDLNPSTPGIQTTFTNAQGTWTVTGGVVTFTPAANFNGVASINYTVNDNGGATSNVATITVNVVPVNDAPVLDNEYISVNYNGIQTGDLTNTGDFDPDGTTLVVNTTPLVAPQNGVITIAQDGTFSYQPNANYVGTDLVVVQICDQGSPLPYLCATDTIYITVNPCSAQDVNQDCDFDGLTNGEETALGSDPFDPDTDGDGVLDGTEVADGTNPLNPCSFVFASQTVTPSTAWNNLDCDNDGLTNGQEILAGTDPTNPDTDGDGVLDGTEVADGTNPNDPCSFVFASQTVTPSAAWNNLDCDNDGLTNGQEVTLGTDPTNPDTDGDGVLDGTEVADGTNPTDPCSFVFASQTVAPSTTWNNLDCDNDGLPNGQEILAGTDPTNPDTDGDGVLDGTEVADGTNPTDPCSLVFANQTVAPSVAWNGLDCDNDGLLNGEEITIGTDPTDPDTDGDGVIDGMEVHDQTNPIDPCQYIFANQTVSPSAEWAAIDCDGDGLTNGEELTNGNDPTDPCDPLVQGSDCNVNISIPEAFSPDGDGTNDTFVIEGIEYFDENEIIIFNRWGSEVFRMSPYNNSWNGNSQSALNVGGDELPTGTYFYILDTKTDKYGVIKGYIYLKR